MPNRSSNTALPHFIAFHQGRRLGGGSEADVHKLLEHLKLDGQVLVFDLETGEQVELGLPQPSDAPAPAHAPARPGRPRLGVVAREVTLLPKDWDWLASQPGGASVTLRKLVLKARRAEQGRDRARQAQVVCYRFISAVAGDYPGFEEATRALFTARPDRFQEHTESWPVDVRSLARDYAAKAFEAARQPQEPS